MFAVGDISTGVAVVPTTAAMDLTSDGLINRDDASVWLDLAARQNGYAEPYSTGDTNLDGIVDAADLNSVALAWRQGGATWSSGDFTGEGTVSAGDLNELALNWRRVNPFAGAVSLKPSLPLFTAASTAVPEPAGGVFLLLGLLFITAHYRQRG